MIVQSPARVSVRELFALALVLALFVALRAPLLRNDALPLGWDSDGSISVLMGKRMFEGEQFPIYYWGQSYMGTLNSAVVAICASVLQFFTEGELFWVLAGRVAMMLIIAIGIVCWWGALRLIFGRAAALMVAVWLTLGPRDVFSASVIPHGSEMAFLLDGILFWFVAHSFMRGAQLRDRGELFVFGFLAGFGWWMNQGTFFIVGATLAALLLRSQAWKSARARIRLSDRFFVRTDALGWRRAPDVIRLFLVALNVLLAALLFLAALRYVRIDAPTFYFNDPIAEPIGAFLVLQILLSVSLGSRWPPARSASPEPRPSSSPSALARRLWAASVTPLLIGFLIGALPPLTGSLTGKIVAQYGLSIPPRTPQALLESAANLLRLDLWRFFGVARSPSGAAFGIVIVATLLGSAWLGRSRISRLLLAEGGEVDARDVAALTILLCIAFEFFSARAHLGSVRYVVASLPLVWGWFAEGLARAAARGWTGKAAAAGAVLLASVSIATTGARVAGELTRDANELPAIRGIEASGYRVCYANYWVASRMQLLSGERVRFIPYRSLDRNRAESARLGALPGRKCILLPDGMVRDFQPSDEPVHRDRKR